MLKRVLGVKFQNIINVVSRENHKMVLVVRTDAGMYKGKMAAQCAHAAIGMYIKLQEENQSELLTKWCSQGE